MSVSEWYFEKTGCEQKALVRAKRSSKRASTAAASDSAVNAGALPWLNTASKSERSATVVVSSSETPMSPSA